MTLHVSFEHFAETAKRVLGNCDVYLSSSLRGTMVTASHPTQEKLISSWTPMPEIEVKSRLEKDGFKVHEGSWTLDGEPPANVRDLAAVHFAAVSYLSAADQPGVWIDAFPSQPSQVQVMKTLYEEFRSTGEMPEVSFEEFVRIAKPNVVIVTPSEIGNYLDLKQPGC